MCRGLSVYHTKYTLSLQKLKEIGEDRGLLRVTVDSGGCSGFQYKYEIDNNIRPDDLYEQLFIILPLELLKIMVSKL